MRWLRIFCFVLCLSVIMTVPVFAAGPYGDLPVGCYEFLPATDLGIVDSGYVWFVCPEFLPRGTYLIGASMVSGDHYFFAWNDFPFAVEYDLFHGDSGSYFYFEFTITTSGGDVPCILFYFPDKGTILGVDSRFLGSSAGVSLFFAPINDSASLSDVVVAADLRLLSVEIWGLVPVCLPVLILFWGIKKGLSWIRTLISGA